MSEWTLVPVEPTNEMVSSGGHSNSEWLNDNAPIGERRYALPMKSVWTAMLAAAPTPPVVLPPLPVGTPEVDALWDHVYEYTHLAEGVHERLEKVCKTYARAALAQYGIKEQSDETHDDGA